MKLYDLKTGDIFVLVLYPHYPLIRCSYDRNKRRYLCFNYPDGKTPFYLHGNNRVRLYRNSIIK